MIDESSPVTPRWHLRFANFKSALALLREGADLFSTGRLSTLERDGFIQRFEFTWEAGWKSMRDYLIESGIVITVPSPPNVIRAAFRLGLITDGEAWINAKNDRNILSHEYALDQAERIARDVQTTYLPLLNQLEDRLNDEVRAGN